VRAVLRAWEAAGFGVRFAPGAAGAVGIALRFDEPGAPDERPTSATTTADCLVGREAFEQPSLGVLPARLVAASVYLRRHDRDALGRPVPLSEEELAGGALHELGHALGFQGHALRGDTVMVRDVDRVRLAGRRVLAGRPFRDATLAALYSVPSGAVVHRSRVEAGATQPFDRLLALARRRELLGPFLRVGDRMGRVAWRGAQGPELALLILDPAALVRGGAPLRLRPYGAALDALEAP
jgi:hypothetical protein